MKSIIFVLHSLAIGGAERRLSTFANYAASCGYSVTIVMLDNPIIKFDLHPDVRVVCVNQAPDLAEYDPRTCELFRLPHPPKATFEEKLKLRAARRAGETRSALAEMELYLRLTNAVPLRTYLKQFPEAIVVSYMTTPNISMMMAAQDLPNRVLFGETTDAATEYSPESPYTSLKKMYYPRAQGALLQTPEQLAYYSFLPETKKNVIPNFIRSDMLPDRCKGARTKEIVNFCRLSKTKNLPLLFEAFSLLRQDYPDYTLSVIGEGERKDELEEKIEAMGLRGCVQICPFDPQVHDHVRDAAMFVSSSDREGISNSMLEAMAIGLPCVCTDCAGGGARMMIEDHVNGLLVPMRDVNALYRAMKELIENPALAEKLSQNAVKIRERLRPDVICRQMLSAILGENE